MKLRIGFTHQYAGCYRRRARRFSFNQFLIVDDAHCSSTRAAQNVPAGTGGGRERVARGAAALHWFIDVEADECGSLNDWLAWRHSPHRYAARCALVSIDDMADDRRAHSRTGKRLRWENIPCAGSNTPHLLTRGNAVL